MTKGLESLRCEKCGEVPKTLLDAFVHRCSDTPQPVPSPSKEMNQSDVCS